MGGGGLKIRGKYAKNLKNILEEFKEYSWKMNRQFIGKCFSHISLNFFQNFFEFSQKISLFYLKSFSTIFQGFLKSKFFRSIPKTIPHFFIVQNFCNTKISKYFSVITPHFWQFFQHFRRINSKLPPNFFKTLSTEPEIFFENSRKFFNTRWF